MEHAKLERAILNGRQSGLHFQDLTWGKFLPSIVQVYEKQGSINLGLPQLILVEPQVKANLSEASLKDADLDRCNPTLSRCKLESLQILNGLRKSGKCKHRVRTRLEGFVDLKLCEF